MQPIALVPLTLVLGAAAGGATALVLRPAAARAAETPAQDAVHAAELVRAVEALSERVDALESGRGQLELARGSAAPAAGAARVPAQDLEALVARLVDERLAADGTQGADDAPAGSGDEAPFDARAALDELTAPGLSEMQRQELWQRLAQAGRLDELVALFEERAEQRPNDPDAQVDLGQAYLQKVFASGNGPMAGKWAMDADRSFDRALTLDERHWDARFAKAVSLSFWPPALGKQGEAIKHFETLVAQQEQTSQEPKHAQAYLMLGNTYQQIGDQAKALAAWQKGAALFPDDAALAQQIANAGGQ
jgi:tetratricopeptide (TPR) repeat protein